MGRVVDVDVLVDDVVVDDAANGDPWFLEIKTAVTTANMSNVATNRRRRRTLFRRPRLAGDISKIVAVRFE